jgi:hypothetical protein
VADNATPYENGGTLTPGTTWVTFPEETFVITDDDLRHVRLLGAVDRMIWAATTARRAHGFPLTIGLD